MGAASLLAFVARHSVFPSAKQPSKSALADVAPIDGERPLHTVSHAQLPRPAGESAPERIFSSFHLDLEERLQLLQLQSTGRSTNLNWLLDVLAASLSTHSSLHSTFIAAANPSDRGASVAKHRADEVLHLLDVCTALKQAVDGIEHQCGQLQHSVESVGKALNSRQSLSNGRLDAAARRLSASLLQEWPHANVLCAASKHIYRPQLDLAEARSSLFLATRSRKSQSATTSTPPHPGAALFSQALDGTMLVSLLALAAIISSLEPPSPKKNSGTSNGSSKLLVKYLGGKGSFTPWVAPLRRLHEDLKQEARSTAGGSFSRDLQGLLFASTKLHASITASSVLSIDFAVAKQNVGSLRKSLRELQLCIGTLRMQLASFFQALIGLRLTLLES